MSRSSSPYHLAIIDMDDTLLGPDKQISPANLQALKRLHDADIEIVVASGRHLSDIALYEKQIGYDGWVISSQGAVVHHAQTNELLYEWTIPPELGLEIQRRGLALGLDMIAYHRTGVFKEIDGEWSRLRGMHSGDDGYRADFDSLAQTGLQKIIWFETPEKLDEFMIPFKQEFKGQLYLVKTSDDALEFLSHQANKVHGAQIVAEKLGIFREQAVAFGDSNNDVELLAWAGMSVAMAHGKDSAKRAARRVGPPGPPESAFARAVDMVLST